MNNPCRLIVILTALTALAAGGTGSISSAAAVTGSASDATSATPESEFVLVPITVGTAPTGRSPRTAEVDAELQATLDDLVSAGATGVLALVDDGIRLRTATSGLARLDTAEPITTGHALRVGSITKTFVATVVLQLVEEGRLDLDDTVEQWLPGLVPGGDQITLRQLLSHTSGLANYTDTIAWMTTVATEPTKLWQPLEMVAMATAEPPMFAPGTGGAYSNTNFVLAGLVVEAVTGDTVGNQISRRILRPLDLDSTYLDTTNEVPDTLAHGYFTPATAALYPGLPTDQPVDTTGWTGTWAWAAGSLVSTVGDLSRFYQELLSGNLLGKESMEQMTTTVDLGVSGPYGLGLGRKDTPCGVAWGHDGGINGYQAMAATDPTGRRSAVVLMGTSPDETLRPLFDRATTTALCHMFGKKPPAESAGS